MVRTLNIILLLIIISVGSLFSQNSSLYVQFITRDNGLASNRINCIYEDKAGFIWFGTQDGLNRFDGCEIETFRHNVKDTNTIVDNRITSIVAEESTGNLWIGTENGLSYFDVSKNVFTCFAEHSGNKINSLCYDNNDQLWIGTKNGLFIKTASGFRNIPHVKGDSNSINSDIISAIALDKNHNIWVGTNLGLDLYDGENDRFVHHIHTPQLMHIRSITCGSHNNLWIGTYHNGLFFIEDGEFTSEIKNYTVSNGYLINDRVQCTIEDTDSTLYVACGDGGLVHLDFKNDVVSRYVSDIYNPNSLNSKAIQAMIKSSTGIIWIGMYNSGVNFIDNNRKPFGHIKLNYKADGLYNNNIRCMFQDMEGGIWIGTKEGGGLSKFNRKDHTFIHYKYEPNKRFGLKDDYVFSINEIDSKHLLIATFREGLAIFNKETGAFHHLLHDPNDPKSISNNCVYTIYKDSQGVIWVGTFDIQGLNGFVDIFDPETNEFETISGLTQSKCFLEENANEIWVGTYDKGLILYNKKTRETTVFDYNISDSLGISSNNISSLVKDKQGKLWVGTDGGGLNLFDIETKTVKAYTVEDGLPNDRVFAIEVDEEDNLWLTTANGLTKFYQYRNEFRNFDMSDGLQGNEFESYVSLKTSEGEMLFGGRNGFNIFKPDEIKDNITIPNVVITRLKLFYKPVMIGGENSPLDKPISETKTIKLTSRQSVVTFEFIALNYSSPENNDYAYKMESFDEDWNYVGNSREATYTNLPHGEYTFRVKASNNDGYWNEEGVAIDIIILPPFWKTWWFRSVMLLLIFGSALAFYISRIYQFRKYQKTLIKKVKERTFDLQQANKILEEKQEEIQEQNSQLIIREENLEELNQKLRMQKEEIEATLQQLQTAQIQLVRSEKMASVGTLISGIAHEINNPLNFIQGGKLTMELFIQDNLAMHKKEFEPMFEMIDLGLKRVTDIVQSLNRFNHRSDHYGELCDVSFIINNCLVMLQNSLKYKAKIIKSFTNAPYTLNGNEGELHQVFLNLLTNASHAIVDKGEITISTKIYDGHLIVEIQDTGSGIKEEDMSKIMDPFFTTKDPGTGTGLGLSITYSILKQHKGSLTFKSKANEGTTAIVSLPII